jgi:hypothetical protein
LSHQKLGPRLQGSQIVPAPSLAPDDLEELKGLELLEGSLDGPAAYMDLEGDGFDLGVAFALAVDVTEDGEY